MNAEKVLEVIRIYRQDFERLGVKKRDYPHGKVLDTPGHALEHCHGMLDKMEQFVQEGRMEKVFRWLGFIQGVKWAFATTTLDKLKDHNRTEEVALPL